MALGGAPWGALVLLVILGSTLARIVPSGTRNGNVLSGDAEHPVGEKSPLVAEDQDATLASQEETEENPGFFEGDIAGVDGSQLDGRNAIIDPAKTWTDGIIPYVLSPAFTSSELRSIEEAFDEYKQRTCLQFVPRTDESDFIALIKGKGCFSQVGRKGTGVQEVSVGSGCLTKPGVILHELMHVAGFWHEQSRADRDEYVTINWKNIKKGMEVNFNKYPWTEIQHLDEPYDVASVMHYGPYSFARNRLWKTIEPKDPSFDRQMGQRAGFSDRDVAKINKLYKCAEKKKPKQKKKNVQKQKADSFLTTLLKYLSKG